MESDKKSTDLQKEEKRRSTEELAQQNVDENLSRYTFHDSNLTTGVEPNVFGSNLNQATTEFLPGQNTIPISQENEFVGRNLGGPQYSQMTGPLTGSQYIPPTTRIETEPVHTQQTLQPHEIAEEPGTEPHKKGFFSKVKGIFHHKKNKDIDERAPEGEVYRTRDTEYVEQRKIEEPGVLDEKGTTVSLGQSTHSNAQLGLPVLGPDYTHGTHGTTTHTVFTGGLTGTEGNLATTSLPVPVEGLNRPIQPGFQPGVEHTGLYHKQGVDLSGANATHIDRDITLQEGGLLGLRQGAVTGNPGDIITNYSERADLDIGPTKYVQPVYTQPVMTQPVMTQTTTVIQETIVQPEEKLINVTSQHLGETGTGLGMHSCSLIKEGQDRNKF